MKYLQIKYIAISILSMLMFSSCVDLDEDLSGQPTPDKFFKTLADFQSYIAGAYTPLVAIYGSDAPYVASAAGEDVNTSVIRWKGFEQANVNLVGSPDDITIVLWSNYYTSISTCNTMLNIINTSSLDYELLKPIEGEARFLRAFNYFQMVRWFGELPILTEENQSNASFEEQSSVEAIYDFIIADLKIAEEILPDRQESRSKPDKYTAKALLAKVYLTTAGFPLNKTGNYTLARDKAKEVIDDENIHAYDLEPTFKNLWLFENRLSNNEFMFTVYADADNGLKSYLHRAIRPWDGDEGGWGDWESDKRFLAQFPIGDNSRVDGTFYLTMRDGTPWQETSNAQPYVGKYRDGGPKTGGYYGKAVSNNADNFFPLIRYSDVLLIYAEAANLSEGSPSAQAYEAINRVRVRAGLENLSGLNKDQFDKAVLNERNWEFAFEVNRWFDICRRHMLKEVIGTLYPNTTIDDHNYLMPKPYQQLSIMKGIKQNPGY